MEDEIGGVHERDEKCIRSFVWNICVFFLIDQ